MTTVLKITMPHVKDCETGDCEHADIDQHELPWFTEKDADYQALQKLILDPKFMESLKFYTRFRHTSNSESVNNLSLSYAGKRFAFRYVNHDIYNNSNCFVLVLYCLLVLPSQFRCGTECLLFKIVISQTGVKIAFYSLIIKLIQCL